MALSAIDFPVRACLDERKLAIFEEYLSLDMQNLDVMTRKLYSLSVKRRKE